MTDTFVFAKLVLRRFAKFAFKKYHWIFSSFLLNIMDIFLSFKLFWSHAKLFLE